MLKSKDGDTPVAVNVDPCAVQGLNIWVKPEPHIRWGYDNSYIMFMSLKGMIHHSLTFFFSTVTVSVTMIQFMSPALTRKHGTESF